MIKTNIDLMNEFTIDNLPDLDVAVSAALEMLAEHKLSRININQYERPLVVGSGNAEATGRIIFADSDAIFASESTVDDKLANISDIDEVIIVSASGGKHAPIIARKAKLANKHTTLITNTANSAVTKELSDDDLTVHLYPKNREPYTYNTSTYLAMILGFTGEDPSIIKQFIDNQISNIALPDLSRFQRYYLIVPPQFAGIIRMLQVKFIELFGRNIARDVETAEYVRHATTVAPSDELFISFGDTNDLWGDPGNRLNIPLPVDGNYGTMMAVGYYIVAQIQKSQQQYFKQNIESYCSFISGVFKENIQPIVEGQT